MHFSNLMPGNLFWQSLEKGITWRDDREWLNGVLRDGEKNDSDHYMLMLGHTPYDDYAAFQRAPCDAFMKKKEIFRYRSDSPFRQIRVSPLSENNFLLRTPFCDAHLVGNKAPGSTISLWYSREKCGSYSGTNEDKFFNWLTKVKFTLLKINKLRQSCLFVGRWCSKCVCFMIVSDKNETNSRQDSALLTINFINALNLRMINWSWHISFICMLKITGNNYVYNIASKCN